MATTTVSLGSVNKASAAKKGGKTYPAYDGIKSVVNQLVEKDREAKALDGDIKRLKAEVAEAVFPFAAEKIKNGSELGVSVLGDKGSALVVYKDDFRSGADLASVEEVIGKKPTEKLFRQRFSLKVNGDTLVEKLGAAKTSKFVAELVALFEKHEVSDALEAKEDFVPTSVADIFKVLTVEQAQALNEVFKVPSSVSVK
jgi:hypothetical protein